MQNKWHTTNGSSAQNKWQFSTQQMAHNKWHTTNGSSAHNKWQFSTQHMAPQNKRHGSGQERESSTSTGLGAAHEIRSRGQKETKALLLQGTKQSTGLGAAHGIEVKRVLKHCYQTEHWPWRSTREPTLLGYHGGTWDQGLGRHLHICPPPSTLLLAGPFDSVGTSSWSWSSSCAQYSAT